MGTLTEPPAAEGIAKGRKPLKMRYLAIGPVVLLTILGIIFIPEYRANQRKQELLEHGQRASAEIVSVSETGKYYDGRPEVIFVLRVRPPDQPGFSLEVTKVIGVTDVVKYVEGSEIEVRYDPAEPDDVVFVGLVKSIQATDGPSGQ